MERAMKGVVPASTLLTAETKDLSLGCSSIRDSGRCGSPTREKRLGSVPAGELAEATGHLERAASSRASPEAASNGMTSYGVRIGSSSKRSAH